MRFLKSLYINNRFYYGMLSVVVVFIASFILPFLWGFAIGTILLMSVLLVLDLVFLYQKKKGIQASRITPDRLSNGDENELIIHILNSYGFEIKLQIVDEIPFQFQKRDFEIWISMKNGEEQKVKYQLRPVKRGVYSFGKLNIYVQSLLGLVSRRYIFDDGKEVATYPSFLQMRQFELMAFSNYHMMPGLRKIKRVGHSTEFDQIKEYVRGDDVRHINWKATARKNQLMINQYQDERAQPVYSIIDKGRVMKMPFEEMSLLDYAINATLALSNIILKKHDKAGMMSISNKVENLVVAERRNSQMMLLMESLYRMDTDFLETDFGRLYSFAKAKIAHRSLFIIYTNFETMDALRRQLPYLKALSKFHLLVVIFFKNTELEDLVQTKSKSILDVYDKAIAEKLEFEKRVITNELRKYGIHAVLTRPENLTGDAINKYLELKARGLV